MFSKYRVTKGFKFHARPQTGAYSCLKLVSEILYLFLAENGRLLFVWFVATLSDFGLLFLDRSTRRAEKDANKETIILCRQVSTGRIITNKV